MLWRVLYEEVGIEWFWGLIDFGRTQRWRWWDAFVLVSERFD